MKNKFLLSGIFFALFLLLIVAVRSIDVAAIGPEGTSIGFAHVNKAVHDFFGVNLFWYSVTDRPGILAIFTAFVFAVTGFFQWIKRKSIWKVDKEILVLYPNRFFFIYLPRIIFFQINDCTYIRQSCAAQVRVVLRFVCS
jgi:hypothetical protein